MSPLTKVFFLYYRLLFDLFVTFLSWDKQNIFLIKAFKHILTEINCPVHYLLDLFINDNMWDAYVFEKCMYKKWKNILLMYRGLFFLLESNFETFMNVNFLKQIIQGFWTEHISEEIVACLIIAGMVLTVTKIWKAFVQERYFSGNIVESIAKAKGKTSK